MRGPSTVSAHPTASLQHIAEVTLGKMIESSPYDGASKVPYIKAASVRPTHVEVTGLNEMYATPADRNHLNVRKGDIFVIEGGATAGRAAVVQEEPPEKTVFQNAVHRIRAKDNADQRFLYWTLVWMNGTDWYEAVCSAATFKHLTGEKMARLQIPLPPLEVQRRVADMLDAETARIDTLVSKNKQVIQTTRRRRDEMVARAVTEGVDGDPTRRVDLGWAQTISENWDTAGYQYVARIGTGHTPSRGKDDYWENTRIPWITTGDVKSLRDGYTVELEDTAHHISDLGLKNSSATMHAAGTVFLSRTASVGFSGVMGQDMATSQDFVTWTCEESSLMPHYLLFVLRAMKSRGLFDRMMFGSTHNTIYFDPLRELSGPLPPREEQGRIVAHILGRLPKHETLEEKAARQIDLLETRRRSLITAAVTGQITV